MDPCKHPASAEAYHFQLYFESTITFLGIRVFFEGNFVLGVGEGVRVRFTSFNIILNFKVLGHILARDEGEGCPFNFRMHRDSRWRRYWRKKSVLSSRFFNKPLLSCFMLLIFESCVKCSLQYNLLSFSANSCPFSNRHSHTTHAKQLMWYTWPAVLITNSLDGIGSPQRLHFVPNNLIENWHENKVSQIWYNTSCRRCSLNWVR